MKDKENCHVENLQARQGEILAALEKGGHDWESPDEYLYEGEASHKLAAKLIATQDALEAMCMEKESQKLFYEERLQVVEAERDELQDEKFVQEKKMEELQETLDALQDEAEGNKEALIGRIQFLSHELEELDKDSREAVTQLDRQVTAVSTALDRVIEERDHACQQLMHAAREKITALVNYSELSTLIHTCLTKKSPQGTLVDENGTTHCEILRKYEQIAAENTTLKFQVQDAITAIQQLQQDLDQTKQARDIEHDRAEMLHEIVEEREEECAEIANAAEEKQQAVTELQETLESMEMQEEKRSHDVDEMALHLLTLRDKLNDMQSEAEQKELTNAENEEEAMREMHQERLSLLERQMHLITELAASEFTILSLTEELEDAHANTTLLQEENALLMSECGLLQDVVPSQGYEASALEASTSRSVPPEITSEACDLRSGAPSSEGLEEGEIVESPSLASARCVDEDVHPLPQELSQPGTMSQPGTLLTENLDTQNCMVPLDQELRGHIKSVSARPCVQAPLLQT